MAISGRPAAASAIAAASADGERWRAADSAAYEADPIGFLRRAQAEHGDAFRFGRGLNTVFVADPDAVRTVLTRTGHELHAGHDPLNGFRLADQARTESWLQGRRAGTPGLGASAPGLARMADRLRAEFAALSGRTVDVAELAPGICSRSTLAYCLDGPLPAALPGAVAAAAESLVAVLDAAVPVPAWVPGSAARRARAAEQRVTALLDALLAQRTGRVPAGEPDLADALAAQGFADRAQARATLQTIVMGGHVIPGAALTWLIAELAQHPEALAAIRAEAGDPAAPYADAVVKEVLRLYPPAWLAARDVGSPIELAGRLLTAGQHVAYSAYLLHRDPRWWATPEEFRPQRWLDAPGQPVNRNAYLPFGGGARICAGYRLGIGQLVLAAGLLAEAYTLEEVGGRELRPTFQSVLRPARLRIRFHTGRE